MQNSHNFLSSESSKCIFFLEQINTELNTDLPLDCTRFPKIAFALCERSHDMQKLTGKEMSGKQNNVLSECNCAVHTHRDDLCDCLIS